MAKETWERCEVVETVHRKEIVCTYRYLLLDGIKVGYTRETPNGSFSAYLIDKKRITNSRIITYDKVRRALRKEFGLE